MTGKTTFTLAADDVVAANRAYLHATLWRRGALRQLLVVWLALTGLMLVEGRNDDPPLSWPMAAIVVAILFVAIMGLSLPLLILFNRWRSARASRRAYAQQATLREPITATWDGERLAFGSASGSLSLPWSGWHAWVDAPTGVLVLQSERLFHILPDRAMSQDQRRSLARHLAAAGVRRLGSAYSTQSSPRSR